MRIGVDATCWQMTRGYGRHARSLLRSLVRLDAGNRYHLFVDSNEFFERMPPEAEVRMVQTDTPTAIAASSSTHRSARDIWRVMRALSDPGLDLLLFPTVYSYVPVFTRAKKVVMIHDIIAEKYAQLTLPSLKARFLWRAKVALGRWQADAIVTVSEYSRIALIEHFGLAPERIFVVGEASDPIFRMLENPRSSPRLDSLGITTNGRNVVYVGGFSPHKNLVMLLSVFHKITLQREFSDVKLIMVGETEKEVFHSYIGMIKRQVTELGIADRVLFTGFLPDEDLVILLNLSTVLALPSLMEGFGLPAIEAAACGCPVVATNESPLPALLADGGLYVSPSSEEDLTLALYRVLRSAKLRRHMRQAGLEAAGELTWEKAAGQLVEVIQKIGAS